MDGYKPSIIHDFSAENFHLFGEYPKIEDCLDGCLIFQSEDQKQRYQLLTADVQEDSPEFHRIIGITLGYPEKSCDWYAKMKHFQLENGFKADEEKRFKVLVHWAGFFFASNVEWVDREIEWIWKRYNHPQAIREPLFLIAVEREDHIPIEYDDLKAVKELQTQILESRSLPIVSFNT